MSWIIALSLSTYAILLVLATYVTETIPPSFLPILLGISILIAFAILRKPLKLEAIDRLGDRPPPPRGLNAAIIKVSLPLLIFLPGFLALLLSTRMQISVHGFFHSGYVFEIMHEIIPPENVTLPDSPANIYWPFHAILAAMTMILKAPPPLVSAWVNILTLLVGLSLSFTLVRLLIAQVGYLEGMAFAIFGIFGTNLFGIFHTWVDNDPNYFRPAVIFGDYRVANMFEKYLNFTGFPVGILFYILVLVVLVRGISRKRFDVFDILLLVTSGLGALLIHSTTGLFMAVVLPIALAGTYLIYLKRTHPQNSLEAVREDTIYLVRQLKSPRNVSIAILLTGISLIVIHSVYRTANALPVKSQIEWFSLYDAQTSLGVVYPILPFFLIGMAKAWKRNFLPVLFLGQLSIWGYLLHLVIDLPDGNDYKFVLLSTIATCFVAAYVLVEISRQPKLGFIAMIAIVLVNTNILMASVHRFRMDWFRDRTFSYQGAHTVADVQKIEEYPDLRYSDVFIWAREVTPGDVLIIVPRLNKDRSAVYLLSERTPYYVDGDIFNRVPEKRERVERLDKLYSSADGAQKLEIIQSIRKDLPERPFLLVYPHDLELPPQINDLVNPSDVFIGQLASGYYLPPLNNQTALK